MEFLKRTIDRNDIVQVLKIRPFFLLMSSEFFSQIAYNMQHFVIIFIIYEITRSNTAVSGVILSFIIPSILFSFLAGVYIDRWDKKRVLLITNIIRGILSLTFLLTGNNIFIMYTLIFFIALTTQFFLPAEAPMIPSLVGKKLLVPANAVFAMGIFSTIFIGYTFSGPALLFMGKTNTFLFLALFFFISAILIELVKVNYRKKTKESVVEETSSFNYSVNREIREAFSFIRKAREVTYALLVIAFVQSVIYVLAVLGPGYVATILDTQVEDLSWIFLAPAAFGMVVGATMLGSFAKRIKNRTSITAGFLISGIVLMSLPLGSRVTSRDLVQSINMILPELLVIDVLHIIVVMAFTLGFANALIYVPANATIQTDTHEALRGRIYGFLNAFISAVSFLPVIIAGSLADIIGVGRVLVGLGLGIMVIGIYRILTLRNK